MKTFEELSIKDKIYYCTPDNYEYNSRYVSSINSERISTGIGNGGSGYYQIEKPAFSLKRVRLHGYYHNVILIFANESECIRYCKAQLIKEVYRRISKVKEAIDSIKQLRKDNYDRLNYEWLEDQIIKLENN